MHGWIREGGLLAAAVDLPEPLARQLAKFEEYGWNDLLWSLGVLAVVVALGHIVARLALRGLRRWARHTATDVDDAVAKHLARPLRWLLPLLAVELAMPLLTLPEDVLQRVRHGLVILLILGIGWLLMRSLAVVEHVIDKRYDIHATDNLQARTIYTQVRVFRNVAGFVIAVLTLAFALTTFDAVRQVGTGLLASAGLAGVVLGFAAQRSLATLVGGIQIALTQPIRVDDVVIVEGNWGRIEEITLTYVVVRIWDLRRLIVPVTYFLEKPFENWTRVSADLLGVVELRLDYAVPIDPIRQELERIVKASDDWDGKSQGVQVTQADDKTITVRPLVSAADSGKLWNLRCEVREKLLAFIGEHYPWALPRYRADIRTDSKLRSA